MFRTTAPSTEGAPASAEPVVSVQSPAPEAKPESPAVKKLKVNGKEVEVPVEKLDAYAQLGLSSTEKFNEAKKLREEAEEILKVAKTEKSALKALEKAGYSRQEALAIVEEELRREYEEMELSPEEKARRAEKAELDRLRKEKEERERRLQEEAQSKEEAEYFAKIDAEVAEALETTDLPKEPILGKWVIQYMASFAEQGEDLSAKEAVKLVTADMKGILRSMLSGMDAKAVKQFLKEDHVKGLQDEALASFREKQQPFSKPAQAPKQVAKEPETKETKVIHGRDFWAKKRGF
jgi:hypothetical protein